MSKHTPEPWATQVRGSSIEIEAESPAGVVEIATVHHSAEYAPSLPVKANARLMAAAPELLYALKWAAEYVSVNTGAGWLHTGVQDGPDRARFLPPVSKGMPGFDGEALRAFLSETINKAEEG